MTAKLDEYDQLAAEAGERVAKLLKQEGAQAQVLFDRIARRHGLPTAKLLFERCTKLAKEPAVEEEQEKQATEKAKERSAQSARALAKLPTLEQIAAADPEQICNWYYRWPDRRLNKKEQEVYSALLQRYVKVGGYPKDFNPNLLTPTKKPGSVMRNSRNAELPALYAAETVRHGGQLTKAAFAAMYADRFGPTAEDVRKKLDYYLKRKT